MKLKNNIVDIKLCLEERPQLSQKVSDTKIEDFLKFYDELSFWFANLQDSVYSLENELRNILYELRNVKGRIPLHVKCHMAGEEETIEEVLGE